MARKPRAHFSGAFYHVIARGNCKQAVFRDDEDYLRYQHLLQEGKQRYHYSLYAYVLMSNHVHLLVEVSHVPLSRIMHNLQFRYTSSFNRRHGTTGHVFQGRYKALLCERDSYFLELATYIHLNPVRAGIVKDPAQYIWSSYRQYIKADEPGIVDRDFLLGQFSKERGRAAREYQACVLSKIEMGHREEFYRAADQRFLGQEEFIEEVKKKLDEELPVCYRIPLDEIAEEIGAALEIEPGLLHSRLRNRKGALGRALAGYLGKKLCGYSNKEAAGYFGREPESLSEGIAKVESRLVSDKLFAKTVHRIEKKLVSGKKKYLIT